MNIFLKNSWIQKLIIAIVIVLVFNFIYPNYAQASWSGGTLINPIKQFVLFIGDTFLALQQYAILGDKEVIVQFNDDWWDELGKGLMIAGGIAATFVAGFFTGGVAWAVGIGGLVAVASGYAITAAAMADDWDFPVAKYSVEHIFSNHIPAFDVNFIKPMASNNGQKSTAEILQKYISATYNALRTFAIVALLTILIYIGIRIIIASTANDKSKYKMMIANWFVAMCLVFLLHYIMTFGLTLVDKFNEMIVGKQYETMTVKLPEKIEHPDTGKKIDEFETDFMGYIRYFANDYKEEDILTTFLYVLAYIILVFLTATFTIMYLKRVIYMAFLTMIAPLVAITYPIDKIKDGKSQAFDFWMKEYFFNLLIQPMHLLLYTILIKSVGAELIYDNILYTLVAIGFLLPAEKFFRKMFGMDKATSSGEAGSFAAGALASQGLNSLMSLAKGGKDKGKEKEKRRF